MLTYEEFSINIDKFPMIDTKLCKTCYPQNDKAIFYLEITIPKE